MQKNDIEIAQNLTDREPSEGILNVSKSRCHQNRLQKQIWSCRKKIKFGNRGFSCIFPLSQNAKKRVTRKKLRFLDKFMIKNVQNKDCFIKTKLVYFSVNLCSHFFCNFQNERS